MDNNNISSSYFNELSTINESNNKYDIINKKEFHEI